MTRINLVPVSELTDQHLLAEYRELPRILSSFTKSLRACNYDINKLKAQIPNKYCLGSGHVKFFYNKGKFLYKRYQYLVEELLHRRFKITKYKNLDFTIMFDCGCYLWYVPSQEDIALSRARIAEKIALKPNWYKKTGYRYDI